MDPTLSFEDMYRRHAADLYRFAYWLSGSKAEADDLTAEAFARAFVSYGRIRAATVKGYLFTIVRNLHADSHRGQRAEQMPEDYDAPDSAPGPEEQAIAADRLSFTLERLAALPYNDRAALLMRAEGGLPYEEIAVALGITVTTAKVKVHRAREKLALLNI